MKIADMQHETAEAQAGVGQAWRESIVDSIHSYADHHDLGMLLARIASEYPSESAEALPLAELERIQGEAAEAAAFDREHRRHH